MSLPVITQVCMLCHQMIAGRMETAMLACIVLVTCA